MNKLTRIEELAQKLNQEILGLEVVQEYQKYEKLVLNDEKLKQLEKELKVLERLKFINYRYQGKSVDEAVALIGVTKRVGYIWQERWNKEGIEGLKPRYKGGKQSKISSEQLEELKKYLIKNNITNTKEIKQIIEDEYQVNFSEKHVRTLIHKMNLK